MLFQIQNGSRRPDVIRETKGDGPASLSWSPWARRCTRRSWEMAETGRTKPSQSGPKEFGSDPQKGILRRRSVRPKEWYELILWRGCHLPRSGTSNVFSICGALRRGRTRRSPVCTSRFALGWILTFQWKCQQAGRLERKKVQGQHTCPKATLRGTALPKAAKDAAGSQQVWQRGHTAVSAGAESNQR